MLKQILIISSFFSFVQGLELQLMGPYDRYDYLNKAEEDLNRTYEAREMSWAHRMYDVSGLTQCMSRECFIVNALAKIKESMANTRCCPGLQDCAQDIKSLPARDWESLFVGANVFASATALLWTLIHGLMGPNKPWKFPEEHVKQGSCFLIEQICDDRSGMEWVHNCQIVSYLTNKPCNYTQWGAPRVSQCCFDLADPTCYQLGLEYNRQTYPALHNQAVLDQWKPFLIAVPIILGVQVAYIGGKKLGRYVRNRAEPTQSPFISPIPDAEIVEEVSSI